MFLFKVRLLVFLSKTEFQQYFWMPHVSPPMTGDQGVTPHGSKTKNVRSICNADTLQRMTTVQQYSKCAIVKRQLNVFLY